MQHAIDTGCFPGAVLLVAKQAEIIHFEAYGRANLFNQAPMTRDTVFDLASLTKPLATAVALMALVRSGRIDLEQPLVSIIPQFANTLKAAIRIRDLLTHASGLPAWRPYFHVLMRSAPLSRPKVLKRLLLAESLIHTPGDHVLYSDLGFMLLAWIVEAISGLSLARFTLEQCYRPLGLGQQFFFPSLLPLPKEIPCAATELCPWRNFLVNRVVHDDNAYAAADLQGHAGLFGSVGAVFRLLSELLGAYHHQPDSKLDHQITRQFLTPAGKFGRPLGFDVPSPIGAACGQYFSPPTIGHLGFTGTSFWMDLEKAIIVILCTNRVHPSRQNHQIRKFRPLLHDTVMQSLRDIR